MNILKRSFKYLQLRSINSNKRFKLRYNFSFNTSDYIDIKSDLELQKPKGYLTICPTPIGNLNDFTLNQYQNLLKADIIACEDTRNTGQLLKLIKERKIKELLEDKFNIQNLNELKDQSDRQNEELFNEEEEGKEIFEIKEISQDPKIRKTREERIQEKINELRDKAKKILLENDTLGNFAKAEDNSNNFDATLGLEDEYIKYLKAKIELSKKRKGRGLLVSYHKYNEDARLEKLLSLIKYGFHVVLVSDAGTPTISDPGYKIVDLCLKSQAFVESLPGPNSAILALSKSGFPSYQYSFEGYLPKTQGDRENRLIKIKQQQKPAIIFENVNRLLKTLISIEKHFGPCQEIFLSFELTKMYEKHYKGEVRQVYETLQDSEKTKMSFLKGELTIIIGPYTSEYNKDLKEIKDDKQNSIQNENNFNKTVELEPKVVAHIINEYVDCSDQQLAGLLKEIFGISKNRAISLVDTTKHLKKKQRGWDDFALEFYTEVYKTKEREQKEEKQQLKQSIEFEKKILEFQKQNQDDNYNKYLQKKNQ